MLTWGKFKAIVESYGLQDGDKIDSIEITESSNDVLLCDYGGAWEIIGYSSGDSEDIEQENTE